MAVRQSRLAASERCERRGWYAGREVENRPRRGVLRGASVHAILDGRARGVPTPREADPQDARVADALAAMVPPEWRYLGSEIPFGPIEGPGYEIEGTLDALYLTTPGVFGTGSALVLVDRKTLAALPGKARRELRMLGPQPFFYGFGVCTEFQVTGLRVEYHFARRPAKGDQPTEPIKTCMVGDWLSLEECREYLESKAGAVLRMETLDKLPVYRAQANTDACFDYGGCAYRHSCAYGPKKDLEK